MEGIRGTGKTHILKMIREECLKSENSSRILPIYISLAKLSEYEALDDEKFRLHLYTSIVSSAMEILVHNIPRFDF